MKFKSSSFTYDNFDDFYDYWEWLYVYVNEMEENNIETSQFENKKNNKYSNVHTFIKLHRSGTLASGACLK